MQNTKETIEVLNDLIQINNDRITGYEKAIKETKAEDEDLKILFATMIAESHRNKMLWLLRYRQWAQKSKTERRPAGKSIAHGWM
jgi:hypothetical protein